MKITVKNFKKFQGQTIEIKRYTILTGENSGGKSSFIKLLLFIKQSLLPMNSRNIHCSSGRLIDLGAWEDLSYKGNKRPMELIFEIDEPDYAEFCMRMLARDESDTESVEKVKNHIGNNAFGDPVFLKIRIPPNPDRFSDRKLEIYSKNIGKLNISILPEDSKNSYSRDHKIKLEFTDLKKKKIEIDTTADQNGLFSTIESTDIQRQGSELLVDKLGYLILTQVYLDEKFSDFMYINPLNIRPERFLDFRSSTTANSEDDLPSVIKWITNRDYPKRLELLQTALQIVGLAEEVRVILRDGQPFGEVRIVNNGVDSNICDVGYGVALQLYIFAKTVNRHKNMVAIEQPEVHLHPKLHALFTEALTAVTEKKQVILETHSEHILRKLQVLVKNQTIAPENIVVYYFKNTGDDFLFCHQISEDGSLIPPMPEEFFDSSYKLSRELVGL